MVATRKVGFAASVFTCILWAILTDGYTPNRQLITYLNPNCSSDCGGGLAYIKARGHDDTLHFLVTTVGTPTAMVIQTNTLEESEDDKLDIDWEKLRSNDTAGAVHARNHKSKVLYSYGVMFTRLFQYNDTGDDADLTNYPHRGTTLSVFDFDSDQVVWENLAFSSSDDLIVLKVHQTDASEPTVIVNGSLTIQFHLFDHGNRADDLPHLEYNEDLTQFDFILHDIDTGNMTSARYGVETIFFSKDADGGGMEIEKIKSVDDEYSPGVFQINNLLSRPSTKAKGGFLQWKPICYTSATRGRAVATSVKKYGPSDITTAHNEHELMEFVNRSIAYGFYDSQITAVKMSTTNFSFGLSKDGFFTKKNYTAWTGSLGYGVPPEDKVSSLVIAVISTGLGLPVILIIFGGVFVCVKKRINRPVPHSFSSSTIN